MTTWKAAHLARQIGAVFLLYVLNTLARSGDERKTTMSEMRG
jgi:hypothetical protein